ncbi:STAS domain-containing protein [bacterium]|nr:STAS domain-containing protein [bacterium]
MDIKEERKGQVVVLTINGRLDSTNASQLDKKIEGLIDRKEKQILLDCSQLGYVSSSGLRVFLTGLKKMNAIHGKFLICSLQGPISEVFDISGFSGIFSIYDSQAKALSAF